jgi:hypothetical protein
MGTSPSCQEFLVSKHDGKAAAGCDFNGVHPRSSAANHFLPFPQSLHF